jgi:hypothetical protein
MHAMDDNARAIRWLGDENEIQRNVRVERSGKKSVVEHDISGGQAALIRILLSNDELSRELRDALAFALEPIGNSLLQLKKRLRRRPGRPSKSSAIRNVVQNAYEVHVVGPEIEAERKNPRVKPPLSAVGMKQKRPRLKDAVQKIAGEQKIGQTKALTLRRSYLNELRNKNK